MVTSAIHAISCVLGFVLLLQKSRLSGQLWLANDGQHFSTKTLILSSEEEGLVADFPVHAKLVAGVLQNSGKLLYPGIGHAPQVEITEQFHADLLSFFSQILMRQPVSGNHELLYY